eukprot:4913004-Pyramimonas_sp.AAC.1
MRRVTWRSRRMRTSGAQMFINDIAAHPRPKLSLHRPPLQIHCTMGGVLLEDSRLKTLNFARSAKLLRLQCCESLLLVLLGDPDSCQHTIPGTQSANRSNCCWGAVREQ